MSKKKILLLSDDLRMHSGIATQSQEFVLGTIHKYDWVQIGAAINHPDNGKIIDMKPALEKEYGIKGNLKILLKLYGTITKDLLTETCGVESREVVEKYLRVWEEMKDE